MRTPAKKKWRRMLIRVSYPVVRFPSFLEPDTVLEIRQGITSQSPLVDTLSSDIQMAAEYLVPVDIGFYIRLRGRLGSEFKMAIAYAAFTYIGTASTYINCS